MISVANKFDIDRNPSSAAYVSFRMEMSRVSSDSDRKSRVPEDDDDDRSPSPESRVSGSDDLSLSVHGFETGDMVWGKVKSHPWWPGHIFNEALASPSVRRTRREYHVLVAFFGDSSYGWFDPSELVHFAPTFLEKSRQTASRSFVKAIEESVDEASRRAALGLSCMCRNPYNFRPTRAPGYLAVDVPGYERGGIYSVQQIEKAREGFVPEESVEFLQRAALAPTRIEPMDLEWIKRIAQFLAFRKARFEEFDETYAQAFGMQLVRPPKDNLENEPEKFAPKVAPLSGPLVIAETLCGKKKKKKYEKKKDRYLLKRRDEHAISTTTIPLPDASYTQPVRAPLVLPSPSPPSEIIDNFVLQKREPESIIDVEAGPPSQPPSAPPFSPVEEADRTMPRTESPVVSITVDHKPPIAERKEGIDASQPPTDDMKLRNKKKKRPREDVNEEGEANNTTDEKKKKKKKKQQRLGPMASTLKKLAMGIEDAQSEEHTKTSSNANVQSVPADPQMDLNQLELPQLLDDLSTLAMDPFYGVERNAPAVACQVFLKFRSLVYQKSLLLPLANEGEDQEVRPHRPSNITRPPPHKEPKEKKKENAPKVKLGSLFKRSSDPTNSGRKRPLSDRQEENSAKRSKKLDLLKSLANGKKAALAPQTAPRGHKDNNAASLTSTAAAAAAAAVDSAATRPERQEPLLPLPPKKESPTNLILKFPPRATLPSVANLKARFARFGPIVVDRCRVIWNTHSCRVQFKYNVDAYEAYNYVRENNLFGQIQVRYSVKEVELPPGSQSEPAESLAQLRPPGNGSGNSIATSTRPSYLLQQQQQGPLKSILKRPGEDAAKENQRVKFKLAGEEEEPAASSSSTAVNVTCPDIPSPPLSSSSIVPLLSKSTTFVPPPSTHLLLSKPTTSIRAPKSTDLLPPPRTTATRLSSSPVPSQPPPASMPPHFRAFENRHPVSQSSENRLRQQVRQYGGGSAAAAATAEESNRNNNSVDVSHKLLSLMLRCNDIVATLKALPGFVPYRPL